MTEQPNTPPETPPDDDGGKGDDQVAKLRREAASHRTKAREAETERDQLRERVEAMQKAEVERLATTAADGFTPLVDAEDFWRGDGDAPLTDEGAVDADAVRERVRELGESKPHLLDRPAPHVAQGESDAGKGRAEPAPERPSFGTALKGAR